MDYRLLVVSSRARNKVAIFNSVLSHNLILVDYNYESTTLDDLLEKIKRALNGTKVASMALVLHTSERELFICSPGSALISLKTLINDDGIKRFCVEIAQNVIDQVIHCIKNTKNSKLTFDLRWFLRLGNNNLKTVTLV